MAQSSVRPTGLSLLRLKAHPTPTGPQIPARKVKLRQPPVAATRVLATVAAKVAVIAAAVEMEVVEMEAAVEVTAAVADAANNSPQRLSPGVTTRMPCGTEPTYSELCCSAHICA